MTMRSHAAFAAMILLTCGCQERQSGMLVFDGTETTSSSKPLVENGIEVADGIPEPAQRNVIVQMFNWSFGDIEKEVSELKRRGYSHVLVSPPQKSNDDGPDGTKWWRRYQPVDFTKIESPLGKKDDLESLAKKLHENNMKLFVDVVLNHTVDVNEQRDKEYIGMSGCDVVKSILPQFAQNSQQHTQYFHKRCVNAGEYQTKQEAWLDGKLADLRTEDSYVRGVAKKYLKFLSGMGADGYRFDAAFNIESSFFGEVLSEDEIKHKYYFGEVVLTSTDQGDFQKWLEGLGGVDLDYYDFPLTKMMREVFAENGDLRRLEDPKKEYMAFDGPKAVTFVRNHDIVRGQANDHGMYEDKNTYGIGWSSNYPLERTDINLAYAYIFGREDGFPLVFVDMKEVSGNDVSGDNFRNPAIVSGIRFHNLCLGGEGGVDRRPDRWDIDIKEKYTIAWQRGDDRFVVINKAGYTYDANGKSTTLRDGKYKDIRTGLDVKVKEKKIDSLIAPPRSALMFVWVSP